MITAAHRAKPGLTGIVDVIVIGAGHSGLAMSHRLTELRIDHVILERGEIANSWRTERWDSLRLFTPRWMSRLPGKAYAGPNPDGYMDMSEVVDFVSGYASVNNAPVQTNTEVLSVESYRDGYSVRTNRGQWWCKGLVLASGAFNNATIPGVSESVPKNIRQISTKTYRNPGELSDGGVLVVGPSASGLQLAKEIHDSGRSTTLAVGSHVRMPRRYRGRDIQWWLLNSGILDQTTNDVDDVERVRRLPSPQLIGTSDHSTIDLNSLANAGIKLVGRLAAIRNGQAQFSGSLRNACSLADLKMGRMLRAFDGWAEARGMTDNFGPTEAIEPTRLPDSLTLGIDLALGDIETIIWATGYRPDYSWLNAPVFDRRGNLNHDGGVVSAPGIYALGLPFMRRRKSSFMHGAEDDVVYIADHLSAYLDSCAIKIAV
jgi:putative flavoprotein involved in K+ transport